MGEVVFVGIVLLRVLVPLSIPRLPIPGIVLALVIDAADQTVLAAFDAEPDNYQGYDKALDVYYLAIAYLSTIRNWTSQAAFGVGQILWYYRLVGVVAFEFSGARALLLIFPNTFEYFFIAYEAVRMRWDPIRLAHRQILLLAASIWIGIKLPQEYWIHIAQLDFTDALSSTWFAVAVVIGIGAIAVLAARVWRSAPEQDWPLALEVDANETTVPFRQAEALNRRWELLNHPLIEKTILTGLLVAVFSQLFAIGATVRQVLLACGFIVVANAFASDWLRRRGTHWQNQMTEFASLLAINWGALIIYRGFRRNLEADVPFMPTLTMLGLLTLVIILYDRFRTVRMNHMDRDPARTQAASSDSGAVSN